MDQKEQSIQTWLKTGLPRFLQSFQIMKKRKYSVKMRQAYIDRHTTHHLTQGKEGEDKDEENT